MTLVHLHQSEVTSSSPVRTQWETDWVRVELVVIGWEKMVMMLMGMLEMMTMLNLNGKKEETEGGEVKCT